MVKLKIIYPYDYPLLSEKEIRNRKREILKKKIQKVYGISSKSKI